jgi:hypothetical protein
MQRVTIEQALYSLAPHDASCCERTVYAYPLEMLENTNRMVANIVFSEADIEAERMSFEDFYITKVLEKFNAPQRDRLSKFALKITRDVTAMLDNYGAQYVISYYGLLYQITSEDKP